MSLREEIEEIERGSVRGRPDVRRVETRLDGKLNEYGFDDYEEAAGWVRDWYDRGEDADGIAAMLQGDVTYD
ncbi:MAG: hypothetical protein ABEK12_00600 [Candidatus Nanohaloarchaea archaeon]